MLNVLPYSVRETLEDASTQYKELPQPAQVVLHLAEPYLDQGRHMFTDRYYTSIPLAEALHDRATSFTGTTNKNRVDLPDQLRATFHLRDGEVMAFRAGHLLTLAWRAKKKKKPVIMLSSESSAATEGATEDQIKPVVVHTYNKHMNGVDIADQYSTYYCFLRKTVKW